MNHRKHQLQKLAILENWKKQSRLILRENRPGEVLLLSVLENELRKQKALVARHNQS